MSRTNRLGQVWMFRPNWEHCVILTPVESYEVVYESDDPHTVLNLTSGRTMPMNLHDIESDPVWTRIA